MLFVQNASSSMFQNISIHRDVGGGLNASSVEIVDQWEDRRLSQLHPRKSHSTPHCADLTPPCPVCVAITKGDHLSGDFIQRGTEEGPKEVAVGCEYNFVRSDFLAEDIDHDIAELLCLAEVHQGTGRDLLAPQNMFSSLHADTSMHLQFKWDDILKFSNWQFSLSPFAFTCVAVNMMAYHLELMNRYCDLQDNMHVYYIYGGA